MPTLALALLLSLSGQSPSPARLRIDLLFNGAPMHPRVEAAAMAEVIHIWEAYGVDIQKINPNGIVRDDAIRLSVVLVGQADRPAAPGVLGAIPFHDGAPEPAIFLYPPAIATLISTVKVSDHPEHDWPDLLRDLVYGRVMGRALAHEVGHYLLRSRQHSEVGLMRAQQSVVDLVALDRRQFALSIGEMKQLARLLSPWS